MQKYTCNSFINFVLGNKHVAVVVVSKVNEMPNT